MKVDFVETRVNVYGYLTLLGRILPLPEDGVSVNVSYEFSSTSVRMIIRVVE